MRSAQVYSFFASEAKGRDYASKLTAQGWHVDLKPRAGGLEVFAFK